ncbi:MAG: murein biosynthesis integral membrane protein MurJ [Nitrospirota bacterium]
MTEEKNVTKAAGVIGVSIFLSRIFGFIRDLVIAISFGALYPADAFYVAFRIPNLLRELFAEGSMSAAFIPVFTEHLTKGQEDDARALANSVFTLLCLMLIGISIIGIITAPIIVRLIAPGFKSESYKIGLTVFMSRIMFPYLIFIGLAALTMGILNSLRSFAIPALSTVIFNIILICAALFLPPNMDTPILALAIGVLAGGIGQFLFQIPLLTKKKMLYRFRFYPIHPGVKKIFLLMIPMMLGLSVTQINLIVNTIVASYLPEGSITYLYYGMRLIHFPLAIFGISLATAILPSMSAQAAQKDWDGFVNTLSFALRFIFFITLPALTGLILLRIPIINLLFQYGRFDYTATLGTANAVFFYSLGLWAFAGVRIVVPAFYALQDTKTPVFIAIISMIVNTALNIILMYPLRHGGLALATSISSALNFSLLIWILNRRLGRIDLREILNSAYKVVIASSWIIIVSYFTANQEIWSMGGDRLIKIIILSGSILTSVIGYFFIHKLLKSEELDFLLEMLKKKSEITPH